MNEIIKIANRLEPFLDDTLVEIIQGVRFELHQPERREVAFSCDAPWEDDVAGFNSVFQDGNKMRMNYSTSATGMVKVEIQDMGNSPVEGYTLQDAQPVYGGQLDAGVGWKDTADVSSLAGKAVRLRFVMQDADLYAIRFL